MRYEIVVINPKGFGGGSTFKVTADDIYKAEGFITFYYEKKVVFITTNHNLVSCEPIG